MEGHLITVDGVALEPTAEALERLLASPTRFWLDVGDLDEREAHDLLAGTFGFHPLAVEDAQHFGQRPKIDAYGDYSMLVVYGAAKQTLVEVHCFYSEQFLVTVHRNDCPDLTRLAERIRRGGGPAPTHAMVLYMVLDTLIDGYFPVLADMDDVIDDLEDQILERPTEGQLGQLFDLKRSLIALRKVVTPQRDMFATFLGDPGAIAGRTDESDRYFRDLYDHLIRISDLVDSYRDLLSGVLDTHLSTVSNRLNVVMKQLTIIATVFLPLSFLTGFFGQNFGWMVNHLTSVPVFLIFGIGLPLAVVAFLLGWFHHLGWLNPDGAPGPAGRVKRPRTPRDTRWKTLHIPMVSHLPLATPHLPGRKATTSQATSQAGEAATPHGAEAGAPHGTAASAPDDAEAGTQPD